MRLAVVFLALGLGSGCKRTPWQVLTDPAVGRPRGCPDGAVAPYGEGLSAPRDARCGFNDAAANQVVVFKGSVRGDDGFMGVALEDVQVVVLDDKGKAVADATTDAQGGYRMSGVLLTSTYEVLVLDGSGRELARRRQRVLPGETYRNDFQLPADPTLGASPQPQP